jgi:hypothetical protein
MCVRAGDVHGTHSYSGYVESSYAKTVWGHHTYVHGGNTLCTNTVAHGTFTKVCPQLQHGEAHVAEYTMHVALVSNTDGLYPIARGTCVKYGNGAYIKYHHGGDTGRGPLSGTICATEAAARKTQASRQVTGQNIPATGPGLGPLRQCLKVREACWLTFRFLHLRRSELGESAIRTYIHVQYTTLSVSFAGENPNGVSLWRVRTYMYNTHSFASQSTINVRKDWCLAFRILHGGRLKLGESVTRTCVNVRNAV